MNRPHNAFEGLARFGYAARGVVYLLLAGLAVFSGGWGGPNNSQGALSTVLTQPFGRILLGAMALGFFGFCAWRVAQGVFNADHRPKDTKNNLARAGKLVSAAAYLSLGMFAAGMALGTSGGSSGQGAEDSWAAMLMRLPFGPWLVGAVGAAVVVSGVGNVVKGVGGGYRKRLAVPQGLQKLLYPLCTYGIAARGVVFAVLGGFLVYAALTVRPEQAVGMGEALDWVRSLPFGGVLYFVVAAGLLAFAGSCFVYALYRKVDAPDAGKVGDAARSAGRAIRDTAAKLS